MNQAFRIGDTVIIYRGGELVGKDPDTGELEIWFRDAKGLRIGMAWMPEKYVVRDGEAHIVAPKGVVMSAEYNHFRNEVNYKVEFDNGKRWSEWEGLAIVPESILTHPGSQMLRDAEIALLNERGIRA